MNLLDLPTELLERILLFAQLRDAWRLSVTCHRLLHIAHNIPASVAVQFPPRNNNCVLSTNDVETCPWLAMHPQAAVSNKYHEDIPRLNKLCAYTPMLELWSCNMTPVKLTRLPITADLHMHHLHNTPKHGIDLSSQHMLRELAVYGHAHPISDMGALPSLEDLRLYNYQGTIDDVHRHITRLTLVECNNVRNIPRFARLRELVITSTSVENIPVMDTLKKLRIQVALSLTAIAHTQHLEILSIDRCPELKSLPPFRHLTSLDVPQDLLKTLPQQLELAHLDVSHMREQLDPAQTPNITHLTIDQPSHNCYESIALFPCLKSICFRRSPAPATVCSASVTHIRTHASPIRIDSRCLPSLEKVSSCSPPHVVVVDRDAFAPTVEFDIR